MHDCTGPFTLLAGLNIASSVSGVVWQETVRAHIATLYPSLIDENVVVEKGSIALSNRPGIGAAWLEERFETDHPGYRCSSL